MSLSKNLILLLFFLYSYKVYSQQSYNEILLIQSDSIIVYDSDNNLYNYSWAGGLNTPQFSSIDINLDGKKDLFIFERSGNKVINLLNTAEIPGEIKFNITRNYLNRFPALHDWALLVDYNNDQKEDIFTYSSGGIAVYKNTSTANSLQFTQVSNSLSADFGSGFLSNIYVSSVDIPAIADIDNDGDIDILTFHILGSYLQLYINQSMEKYGNSDSLDFILANNCWGNIAESENANRITLNIDCPYAKFLEPIINKTNRHTGSTISAMDLNNDSFTDVLIGDIDFRNMYALYSNSNTPNAIVTYFDSIFPSYDTAINITSMPAAYFIDLNNDNNKDLIVAPNDSRVSDTYRGVCLYENTNNTSTTFKYKEKGFLQNDMIEIGQHSYPLLYDYDKDGLTDLIIGNYGTYAGSVDSNSSIYTNYYSRLFFYKNVGTTTLPSFKLESNDIANLSSLKEIGFYPTFGDINNDNKDELLIGCQNGKLLYLENTSVNPQSPNYELINTNYFNIDIGSFSTPQIIDLNEDGLLDLVIGAKDGKLYYFENTGTLNNPYFSNIPTNNKLGNVLVNDTINSNFGYSKPFFFRINNSIRLFVGSQSGKIFYYSNIENNLSGNFDLINPNLIPDNLGAYTSITLKDLTNDSYPEAIIGNEAGGLNYFKGVRPWGVGIESVDNKNPIISPNPCKWNFSISNANIEKVEIFNIEGQKIMNFKGFSTEYILESSIIDGIYTVKITLMDNSILYTKLVVMK